MVAVVQEAHPRSGGTAYPVQQDQHGRISRAVLDDMQITTRDDAEIMAVTEVPGATSLSGSHREADLSSTLRTTLRIPGPCTPRRHDPRAAELYRTLFADETVTVAA